VRSGGRLALALYNDQGTWSRRWLKLKRLYNALPSALRLPYAVIVMGARELSPFFWLTIKGKPHVYFRRYFEPSGPRGMNYWTDMVDWIGGYPFEVASPELVFRFLVARGFEMIDFSSRGSGHGCNEYLFQRKMPVDPEGPAH
jgi:2-polyprenyl-6-hydroxyphenyl methylase/3-demethylubiquinone-9 3-methyltransferase